MHKLGLQNLVLIFEAQNLVFLALNCKSSTRSLRHKTSSKLGLQSLVFKTWFSKLVFQSLVFKAWFSRHKTWSSKLGLQSLVFKTWPSKLGFQSLVFKAQNLVFKTWFSKLGFQNLVFKVQNLVFKDEFEYLFLYAQHSATRNHNKYSMLTTLKAGLRQRAMIKYFVLTTL